VEEEEVIKLGIMTSSLYINGVNKGYVLVDRNRGAIKVFYSKSYKRGFY
jgi:hypothetical protein